MVNLLFVLSQLVRLIVLINLCFIITLNLLIKLIIVYSVTFFPISLKTLIVLNFNSQQNLQLIFSEFNDSIALFSEGSGEDFPGVFFRRKSFPE
jgi:uncharacterized SAM-binding protein YcdF (DUF218 family)